MRRNTCARPNWACSYAPTMTECAFRRKAAQMFRVRFRFWRADDLQMACITSAKPPGTQKSHVRARDVSPSRSTMLLEMRRRCSANMLFDRGYNASKRPSISHLIMQPFWTVQAPLTSCPCSPSRHSSRLLVCLFLIGSNISVTLQNLSCRLHRSHHYASCVDATHYHTRWLSTPPLKTDRSLT
jgi:hypothetical protein